MLKDNMLKDNMATMCEDQNYGCLSPTVPTLDINNNDNNNNIYDSNNNKK